MVQLNLASNYAVINYVKVRSIKVDPINQKVYASVYYCYSKDNMDRPVDAVRYGIDNNNTIDLHVPSTVLLQGADYTSYNTYIGLGKTAEEAVLQILIDRNVLSGTIV